MVEPGQRSDERTRRQQPAGLQRGRERHAERERNLADRHAHRRARRGDGRRYGRHADLQPGRADAASFAINETNGQILTKSGVTLIAGETYTVTVAVDDGNDTTTIAVSIEATAAPPNRPPVFSEGASATRSVREDAAPGTSIGSPVRATDADQGDTRTYTLGGTDAASFTIVSTSGQIRTRAALDYETKASYTVTVTATDTAGGSDSITVTVNVTQVVVAVYDCARGAVADASNTGLVSDCEALLGRGTCWRATRGWTGRTADPSRSGRASTSAERPCA